MHLGRGKKPNLGRGNAASLSEKRGVGLYSCLEHSGARKRHREKGRKGGEAKTGSWLRQNRGEGGEV